MTTKKKDTAPRYFIVERTHLGMYGNEEGSTQKDAEQLLAASEEEAGNLVVIRGTAIKPTFKLAE